VVTRYDDVVALLRQPNLFSSAKGCTSVPLKVDAA
jgi:hypothetical protein